MHNSFSEILGLWPTHSALAAEIGASPDRVRKWSARNSIPGEWFAAITAAARRNGWPWVTADLLAQIAAAKMNIPANGEEPVNGQGDAA